MASLNHRRVGKLALAHIPRYVRVNTLLWTTEEAIRHYQKEGFQISPDPLSSEFAFRPGYIAPLLINSQEILCSRPARP